MFTDLLDYYGLVQHVSSPTHTQGHLLDLIITKPDVFDGSLIDTSVSFALPSDHALVTCSLSIPRPKPVRIQVNHRKLRDIDLKLHCKDIKVAFSCERLVNLSDQVDYYNTTLQHLLDKHAPQRLRSVTLRPHAPWFNEEIKLAKQDRRRCERKWKNSGLEIHKQIFKERCTAYTNLINQAKKNYHIDKLSSCDQKTLFREVDKLTYRHKPAVLPSTVCHNELPAAFSNYFKTKVDHLAATCSNVTATIKLSVELADISCTTSLSQFKSVSASQVESIIKKSPTKSCSLDPLPTVILKKCLDVILNPIVSLINTSLSTGEFPSAFKISCVKPIIKKPKLDQELLENYRPISNLQFLSKVLERTVAYQLHDYLSTNNLYPRLQSAYRKNHSTETALLKVQNDLLVAIDNGYEAVLVLLDFSAAFDLIDHKILFSRLKKRFGLCDTALAWIVSYLSHRKQFIKVGNIISNEEPIIHGVPQGSVLGPLLFILYTSEIEDIFSAHSIDAMTYADDTQFYIALKDSNRTKSIHKLQSCINDIRSWSTMNKLVLNDGKTEIVHIISNFARQAPTSPPDICCGNTVIVPKSEARTLGLTIDENLLLKSHVNNICRSAFCALSDIGKIRKFLDLKTSAALVNALVISRLDHCNSLLAGLPQYELEKLQKVFNTAARIVTRTRPDQSITHVLKSLHWLPIEARIQFKLLVTVFKGLNTSETPVYIKNMLKPLCTTRTLRSSTKNLLTIPRSRTKTYGDRAFSVIGPTLWNKLPDYLRHEKTLTSFKSKLKTFLFKHFYD